MRRSEVERTRGKERERKEERISRPRKEDMLMARTRQEEKAKAREKEELAPGKEEQEVRRAQQEEEVSSSSVGQVVVTSQAATQGIRKTGPEETLKCTPRKQSFDHPTSVEGSSHILSSVFPLQFAALLFGYGVWPRPRNKKDVLLFLLLIFNF